MGIFYDYTVNTGKINMEIDANLLDNAILHEEKQPILRLYGWKPSCVSLGRNQTDEKVNKEYCKLNNIDIVRRITGGRGLLHDDELTYSFICSTEYLNCTESIIASYKEISSALIKGLKNIGIETYFPEKKKIATKFDYCMSISTGADLSYNNMKIVGSAQFRKQNYILQHGSILISYNKNKIEKIFNEKISDNTIISISEIKNDCDINCLKSAIREGFCDYFNENFN